MRLRPLCVCVGQPIYTVWLWSDRLQYWNVLDGDWLDWVQQSPRGTFECTVFKTDDYGELHRVVLWLCDGILVRFLWTSGLGNHAAFRGLAWYWLSNNVDRLL